MRDQASSVRPLDATAVLLTLMLCVSWSVNQVVVKLTLAEIPPLTQCALRSAFAAILVGAWFLMRRIPMNLRDGTLVPGVIAGLLFGLEFLLIFVGLLWTSASRATLFLFTAPFFVVIGSRFLFPADHFSWSQWLGLALSFTGIALAFGLPTADGDPRQFLGDVLMIGAALAWAATTLVIKASKLNSVPAEKTGLYQLAVSAVMLSAAALLFGERIAAWPSALALGFLAYQSIWVASLTYLVWFALIVRYSANRLSAFTFLTPIFGVFAAYLVLHEPLTPAFLAAAALVVFGLILVNPPVRKMKQI